MAHASKRLSASELKAFRAEKRKERLSLMDRAAEMRSRGASLAEIAEALHRSVSTVGLWLQFRAAAATERAVSEERRRVAS